MQCAARGKKGGGDHDLYNKGAHAVAYADCFAAALGMRKKARVVTGDPEFKKCGELVAMEWLA